MTGQPSCRFARGGAPFACQGPDYREVSVKDWGVESGHFIAWMRVAGLARFQKLWGKVDEPLKAGTRLRVHVQDNFPMKAFGGRKRLILSTSSEFGGRNDALGCSYMLAGICCLALSVRQYIQRRVDRLRASA
mmetsp:Transcript_45644/g.99751  ORF Transcript_45644/g.99751 Transcript_45644/m.99751 type:complete len:133 (+) Transcript_45644:2-400(+)